MNDKMQEKYARLVIKTGINLQKNQIVVINSPIECASFARILSQMAYDEGAREVIVNYKDEQLAKIKYLSAPEEIFDEYPNWMKEFFVGYANKDAAFIHIDASDPEIFKDVDTARLARTQKVANIALKEYRDRIMNSKNVWCIVAMPTVAWAKKVFADLSEEEAVAKLQEAIYKSVRVDLADPVAAWDEHKQNLQKNMDFLNKNRFSSLRYKNNLGTDFTLELPEGHIWAAGAEKTQQGVEFVANMPTEEVFSMPKRDGINGTVVSSKPLIYQGNIIDEFTLVFQNGRVVEYSAKKGYETLKGLLETDEGASYLGEVALVPYDSPISNSQILFYSTLFDENASCHLAFGRAYPSCIEGGTDATAEELEARGANNSLVHVDFMIGTPDLQIVGILPDGTEIAIFQDGNFAF